MTVAAKCRKILSRSDVSKLFSLKSNTCMREKGVRLIDDTSCPAAYSFSRSAFVMPYTYTLLGSTAPTAYVWPGPGVSRDTSPSSQSQDGSFADAACMTVANATLDASVVRRSVRVSGVLLESSGVTEDEEGATTQGSALKINWKPLLFNSSTYTWWSQLYGSLVDKSIRPPD